MKFGITVGNAGTTSYSIHNIRSSVQVVTNFINHGICAASALVGDSLDALSPVDSSIPAGGVGVVREWSVPAPVPPSTAESLVGGIIEFTVSNTAPGVSLNYRVRTSLALGTTANLRLNQTPVVPYISSSDGTHHVALGISQTSRQVPITLPVQDGDILVFRTVTLRLAIPQRTIS